MNARRLATFVAAVVAAVSGCGASSAGMATITSDQYSDLNNLNSPALTALHKANYTPVGVGTTKTGRSVVLLRNCHSHKQPTDCLENVKPGTKTPDVYLHTRGASADELTLTGNFDLLYGPASGHHPDNGLRCDTDPSSASLTAGNVENLKALGKEAHELNYKKFEGGNPIQTLRIGGDWWQCRSTFGQRL